ncbi:phage baseplate assembly protein V [Mesorhizobium sp. M1233]|uniref:phage baseplate assembly protein V n=1 Tax=unclassified Mesorhizobium TaxID=325217 RepID=UPI00333607DF
MNDLVSQATRAQAATFYGKYRGFVTNNADPNKVGRVRARVPSITGQVETAWALPCFPFGGLAQQSFFMVPEVGAQIWIEFEEGNLSHPVWTGTFLQGVADALTEVDTEPTARLVKTPSGHMLYFQDKSGEERVTLHHSAGAELLLDEKGSLAITDKNGATLTIDANAGEITMSDTNGNTLVMSSSGTKVTDSNGNSIDMAGSGITVRGQQIVVDGQQVLLGGQGGEPLIKGQSFLSLFMTHIHPTGVGPSGPPIPQGEMTSLSTKVMSA